MTVVILDLDWMFDKSDIPNVNCMKLSSFHKQRGDSVYFIGEMSELSLAYDRLYVFGESDSTPVISSKLLNDERTILFGKRFELCGAKKLGTVVLGCRPDYLLYDITDENNNSYAKANFVTFFTDAGNKIQKRQEWKNTKKGVKRTIVTDTVLWRQKPEEVEKCLEELKDEKNIVFLTPISIRFLIDNKEVQKKFFSLHFSKGTKFKWRNDVGSDKNSAIKICDFLNEFKKYTKSQVGAIPIQPHLNENENEDIKRLFEVFTVFKKNKLRCFLPPMEQAEQTIYHWLRRWCDKGFENSFIEEMVFFTSASKGKRWSQVINEPSCWTGDRVRFLIQLLDKSDWKDYIECLCIQWGGDSINPAVIDFDIIHKNAYMIL